LRDFAPVQAARFSWEESARRTLAALRALVAERAEAALVASAPARKPRLAFVSPLPPERSGISFYSAELLPELAEYYDIDLILAQDTVAETVDTARFQVRDVQWLRDHRLDYDRVLYQFGNSAFHTHMFELLAEIPGVVVLHDFFLSNIEAHLDPARFTRILAENHGYRAVMERYDTTRGRDGLTEAIWSWPANARALHAAEGVIVHSDHARMLALHFYGTPIGNDLTVIPQLCVPCGRSNEARTRARAELGLAADELLICTFGYLSTAKLVSRLMDAFLCSDSAQNPKVHLVYVGEGGDLAKKLLRRVAGTRLEGRVRITGWASEEVYHRHLLAADFAVQLRSNSRGETSRGVLDCQNYGLAVIVNAHGSLVDLRSDTVLHIPDQFSDAELAEALDRLAGDHDLRARIGAAARNQIVTEHAPAACARAYREAIESFHQRYHATGRDLFVQLAQLPTDPGRDTQLAQAITDNFPPRTRLRQLLVDVTELTRRDVHSGVQRVVRAILSAWLRNPPAGWRVEPVLADPLLGRYRCARQFTCQFLGIPDDWASDTPVDFIRGDRFVGLDLQPHVVPQMREALSAMAAAGVVVSFVVYDLLPVLMPQHFGNASEGFAHWLNTVARHERLICISRTVAEELHVYLDEHSPANGLMPQIGWFHLGADLENTVPTTDLPKNVEAELKRLKSRPSFLMVGTIEPRKGHAFALDAFELFWAKGGDATLVIVGKEGWQVEALCRRLRKHPENERRLIWLDNASDAYLHRLYKTCDCLIAASEGEGFGLPLIEASKHDLPILARDIPVFHEVAGEHATYFDGSGPNALVHAIEDWLAAQSAGNVLRSGGLGWLTWRESATALLRKLDI
jgi:glycosyltransferase involved in cell wall biosynthesis